MTTDDLDNQCVSTQLINGKQAIKKYQCEKCLKWFNRPSALQSHVYTHTGEKPYQCDISGCDRRFAVISNLRRHLRVHKHSHKRRRLTSQERLGYVQRLIERTDTFNNSQLNKDAFKNICYLSGPTEIPNTTSQHSTSLPFNNLRKLMPNIQSKAKYSPTKPACLTVKHLLNDD